VLMEDGLPHVEKSNDVRPLLVTNDFPPKVGGIQHFALQLASRLPDAAVLAGAHPDAEAHDASLPFRVMRGPSAFMLPSDRTLATIREAVETHRAGVVVFLSPLPLTMLAPDLGVPWVAIAHGAELTVPSRLPGVAQAARRRLVQANGLFAVSRHTAGRLREFLGDDAPTIQLVRNGVALDTFRPDLDGTEVRRRFGLEDDPVIACVGRLVPRKGQDRLIAALPEIRRRVPGTRLLLVGEGRLRERLERAADRLPAGAVTFTGGVSRAELAQHFAAADVFAHPNRPRWFGLEQEGFGIIFLEAQACGKPVIAGRSGGAPEAVVEGETGLVVDGTDAEAIAEAATRLLDDRSLADRMGRAGRALVERRFSWDDIATGFYEDLRVVTDDAAARGAPR
jgi:phosphatidyl-myo-inositol dimannoside synthase